MKAVITGLNGTLAPVLAATLAHQGVEVSGWDRRRVPVDEPNAMTLFLADQKPDWICHLAMGDERWARFLASHCQQQGIGFLFASTAMVFANNPDGPHRVGDLRTAMDDYGRGKIRCEDAISAAAPSAIIARFGWQIGTGRGGNNMIEALYRMMEQGGRIAASSAWIPASSLMTDTCAALWQLMQSRQPGTYHLDSNAQCALTFVEIVNRLKSRLGADWRVDVNREYRHDQRLLDWRIALPSLAERL